MVVAGRDPAIDVIVDRKIETPLGRSPSGASGEQQLCC